MGKRYSGGFRTAIVVIVVLSGLLACALAALVYLSMNVISRRNAPNEPPETDVQPSEKEDKDEVIHYNSGTLGDIIIPALDNVPKSELDAQAFSKVDGIMSYSGGDYLTGIDVSSHQGEIDWQKVKDAGVDFAMIRVGYRGYTHGNLNMDEYFESNIEGALDAGIKVGVYFFSQATMTAEALQEANFVLDAIEDYDITCPVVYDWEIISSDDARTNSVRSQTLTDCAKVFCAKVKEAGYEPMIYSNKALALFKYDLSQISEYPLWIADYNDSPSFYYKYDMWQYTDAGKIDGIDAAVDLNIAFKNYT